MSSSSLPEPAPLVPGSPIAPVVFGDYHLLGLIARGGMAEVYRAQRIGVESESAKLVAIKVMRPGLAKEARFVNMFRREGELALLLKNRAIVETFELGDYHGRHYIAMEYISGRDLTHILKRCKTGDLRIPVPHVVHIGVEISRGLDFAHKLVDRENRPLNLVNRDVSPSNMRITYNGDVKLLDFGIAQALLEFTSEIGVLKGKFSYMSPEQIRGMPVDQRTDIFSAGIILHEMLTSQKLFRGDNEFALMERVRKAEVSPPSVLNRRVSPELDRIVMRALARDVSERYQRSEDLFSDLSAVLEGYQFEIRELRDFMHKEFKREFLKEQDVIRAAHENLCERTKGRSETEASSGMVSSSAVSEGGNGLEFAQIADDEIIATKKNTDDRATMTAYASPAAFPVAGANVFDARSSGQNESIDISSAPSLLEGEGNESVGTMARGTNTKSGFWSRVFKKRK